MSRSPIDLFLLRHGVAEERVAARSDQARALTSDGIEKMRRIARGMKILKLSFDRILTSPLVRARQTAEIVCEFLQAKGKLDTVTELSSGADPEFLFELLRGRYGRSKSLLLVGHEPDLSEFASRVLIGSPSIPIHFKKGGLCLLTVAPPIADGHGLLEWHLAPGQLARLGELH